MSCPSPYDRPSTYDTLKLAHSEPCMPLRPNPKVGDGSLQAKAWAEQYLASHYINATRCSLFFVFLQAIDWQMQQSACGQQGLPARPGQEVLIQKALVQR